MQQCATGLGLRCNPKPIDDQDYDGWVSRQGKVAIYPHAAGASHYSRAVSCGQSHVGEQGLNIDVITRLSGRPPRVPNRGLTRACVEFSLRGEPRDTAQLKASLLEISSRLSLDLAWQRDDAFPSQSPHRGSRYGFDFAAS